MTRSTHTPRSVGRQPDVLADAGLALARPLSRERVLAELVGQLHRAVRSDAIAIALADEGDPESLHLAHHTGFEEQPTDLAARLRRAWREAVAAGTSQAAGVPQGLELTAPIRAERHMLGALTVVVEGPDTEERRAELVRTLAGIGALAGAALERAAAVRQLEHKRRVATVDEVSVGLAHELRNRLFGISSAAQLLRFRVTDDPAVEKNVGRILREVERMNSTVNSLLEFGQPNRAQLVPGDPDDVWDAVLDQQRGQLESKALNLVRSRAQSGRACAIDRSQLAIAFTNLLSNAADAAPEGSDLSLASARLASGAWRCRLSNGGAPMSAEGLDRAFDLFYTTKVGGTGMGLPLSQRIIDDHGGTIALESTAEGGTVVSVTLPCNTA